MRLLKQDAINAINRQMLGDNIKIAIAFFKDSTSNLDALEKQLGTRNYNALRSHIMALRQNQDEYLNLMSKNHSKFQAMVNLIAKAAKYIQNITKLS